LFVIPQGSASALAVAPGEIEPMDPRPLLTLLTASLLPATLPAQIASNTSTPAQSATPAGSTTASLAKTTGRQFPVEVSYYLFIMRQTETHEFIQQEIRDNPKLAPDIELRNMSASIGIPREDYQTILTYIFDTRDRLKENERVAGIARREFQQSPTYSFKSPIPPELAALDKEHGAIIDRTIEALKYELGEESFKKLNTYVDFYWGGKPTVFVPGNPGVPIPAQAIVPSKPGDNR
jgi:hypothetical protein